MGEQFLDVIDVDEAHRRFDNAVQPAPLGVETVGLADALGRILAEDLLSPIDVPGFPRSNVDGFAVRARDTFGAEESSPKTLALNAEDLRTGVAPAIELKAGTATRIATGGVVPPGADAVVMVELAHAEGGSVRISRAVTPGTQVTGTASDMARGERVLMKGTRLSARETGTIAALGLRQVPVWRRPRVAVFSTGDELVAPGGTLKPGMIFDSNLRILCDTVRELGAEPVDLGIVPDDPARLRETLKRALECDAVVLSGGTSKGEGDLCVPIVRELATVVCHGVALKPGKPICLAVRGRTPVVVLPGFPTSAIFTFHEFVRPVLLAMAGAPPEAAGSLRAVVPVRINTERGRAEYVLVSLIERDGGWVALPMGKGSGSVTRFSRADGFIRMGRQEEYIEAGETVEVRLLGRDLRPADLVVMGLRSPELDLLLSRLRERGFTSKGLYTGEAQALPGAERGDCDLAVVKPGAAASPGLKIVPGFSRGQERHDFAFCASRWNRPAVAAFRELAGLSP